MGGFDKRLLLGLEITYKEIVHIHTPSIISDFGLKQPPASLSGLNDDSRAEMGKSSQ